LKVQLLFFFAKCFLVIRHQSLTIPIGSAPRRKQQGKFANDHSS